MPGTLSTTNPEFIAYMARCPRAIFGDLGFYNWVNGLYAMSANPPTLASIAPTTIAHGAAATTITLSGTNFVKSCQAYAGATALSTTWVSATSLTALIPASMLANAGTLTITVHQADAQNSAGQTFTVS